MRQSYKTLIVLLLLVVAGCGHQPMGTSTGIAILGQVEHYHITHIYFPGAIVINTPAHGPTKANAEAAGGPVADLGIGNGSTAYIFGPTIWGYQGYKSPVNKPVVKPGA